MKKRLASLLLASALFHPVAQAAPAAGWDTALRIVDAAYWAAYNSCDLKVLSAMNTDDLEFFHDVGGVMHGKAEFDQAMAHNICGNPAVHVRREAIPGTVGVYPLLERGVVYGAVIEGQHRFYEATAGQSDVLTGQARFTSVFLLKDGTWKMARVLSFDHQPAKPDHLPAEVQAAPQALALLAGTYIAKDKMLLTVKANGNHVLVDAAGSTFELYPTAPNNFALKERPITVAFTVDPTGKGQSLVVKERGAVVAEATRSPQ